MHFLFQQQQVQHRDFNAAFALTGRNDAELVLMAVPVIKEASGGRKLLPAYLLINLGKRYLSDPTKMKALVFVVLKVVVDLRVDVNQLLDCRDWVVFGVEFLLLFVIGLTNVPLIHGKFSEFFPVSLYCKVGFLEHGNGFFEVSQRHSCFLGIHQLDCDVKNTELVQRHVFKRSYQSLESFHFGVSRKCSDC